MTIEDQLYIVVEKAKKYDSLLRMTKHADELCCSFCNKGQSEVDKLIAGPFIYICNECIELCQEILEEDTKEKTDNDSE